MEAHEIAEQIHEHSESHAHAAPTHDWFRRLTAIYIGVTAMLLAIATLGGAEATKDMLNSNIHASDTYAFYQAKNIRQTLYQISAAELELLTAGAAGLSAADKEKAAGLIKRYRDNVARYESEPETKEGKKELMARAKEWDAKRDHAAAKIPNFEYAEAAFQIAIVLGSVAILAASPALLGLSGVISVFGILLTLNGFILLVPLHH